jgi:branched-chain amino acid transport system ATP-binding protein
VIEVKGINAGYGPLHIIFDIDMTFKDREVTCIVGPNGSGKSTLLKTIFGLTSVYSGTIRCGDSTITKLPPYEIARRGVAYLPQTDNIFGNLTVAENLWLASYTLDLGSSRETIRNVLSLFPVLNDFMGKSAGLLSGGERQMLALCMALVRKPQVIMLDEPTANLAPKMAKQLVSNVKMLRDDLKLTVILVEQNAKLALDLSDHAFIMGGGRKIAEGEPGELLKSPDFNKMLLGIVPAQS